MKKIIICLSCFILAATAAFSACAPSEEQAGEQFDKTLTVEVGMDPSQATDASDVVCSIWALRPAQKSISEKKHRSAIRSK